MIDTGLSQPERPNPMSDASPTRFRLDPANPPQADWAVFDARTESVNTAAALTDPDAQPTTPEMAARARRTVDVKLIRETYCLTQEQFARRFGLRLEMVRSWEDRTLVPDAAAVTLLRVIWQEPDVVRRVVAAE